MLAVAAKNLRGGFFNQKVYFFLSKQDKELSNKKKNRKIEFLQDLVHTSVYSSGDDDRSRKERERYLNFQRIEAIVAVGTVLLYRADKHTLNVYSNSYKGIGMTYQEIAIQAGISLSRATRAISDLKEVGYLETRKQWCDKTDVPIASVKQLTEKFFRHLKVTQLRINKDRKFKKGQKSDFQKMEERLEIRAHEQTWEKEKKQEIAESKNALNTLYNAYGNGQPSIKDTSYNSYCAPSIEQIIHIPEIQPLQEEDKPMSDEQRSFAQAAIRKLAEQMTFKPKR